MDIIWRLRILLFYLLISAFTIVAFLIIVLPLTFIQISYKHKYKIAIIFSNVFIYLAKYICGLKYKVSGLEKLSSPPYVVVANHQSFWENVFMQIIFPEHTWVIKRELFNIPFFGWGFRLVDPIAIDRSRSNSINQILEQGQQKLLSKQCLIIFPEGTRILPHQTTKFKASAAKLTLLAKVPLVIMVHNAGLFWPKGFWLKKPGTIEVKIVEVMQIEQLKNYDARSLTAYIEEVINREKQKLL